MNTAKGILAFIAAIVLIAAIAIGGWQLGWWMERETTNRRTDIANDSLARQQALVDEAIDKAADIARIDVQLTQTPSPQIEAQRNQVVEQFCSAHGRLTGRLTVPASVDALSFQECS